MFAHVVYLHGILVNFVYEVKVKVAEAKQVKKITIQVLHGRTTAFIPLYKSIKKLH